MTQWGIFGGVPGKHAGGGVMTAYGTADLSNAALEMGAYRVVPKPFDMHDLEPLLLEAYQASRP